jgi:hypothetical protein
MDVVEVARRAVRRERVRLLQNGLPASSPSRPVGPASPARAARVHVGYKSSSRPGGSREADCKMP